MIRSYKKYFSKIVIFIAILIILVLVQQVNATMSSNNYNIWIDTFSGGGGDLSSSNYQIDSSISFEQGATSASANFSEIAAFSAIDDEPTVGFSIQSVTLNFGELSPSGTAYDTHTFSAYTNAQEGYTIKVYGDPLNNVNHTLAGIGSTSAQSQSGAEQFGINLVANTVPISGANPSGGIGQSSANYDTSNYFAYASGDIIAQAASYSYQTDFTTTVIVNISEETPAGAYTTVLTYEFIPVF